MSQKPGGASTFSAFLGIIAYGIGTIMSISVLQILLDEPETFSEGFVNIFASLIILAIAFFFTLLGTVFALLGQIWNQSRGIALLSTLAFLPNAVAVFIISFPVFQSGSISIDLVAALLVYIGVFALHIMGIASD